MGSAIKGFSIMFENDLKRKYLVISPDNGRRINGFQFEMITNNQIPGLLSVEIRERNSLQKIYYDLTGLISLPAFLRGPVPEDVFIKLLRTLTSILLNSDRYLLDMHSFIIAEDFIYVDPKSGRPFLAFLPAEKQTDPVESFKSLVFNLVSNFQEMHPLSRLPQSLTPSLQVEAFSLSDFSLQLKELVIVPDDLSAPVSAANQPKPAGKKRKELIYYLSVLAVVFAAAAVKFGIMAGAALALFAGSVLILAQTVYTRAKKNSGFRTEKSPVSKGAETVLLQDVSCPVLQEIGGNSLLPVNRPEYNIGRSGQLCDCILPNRSIGRIHARIKSAGGRYHLFDLNSKNGTYLNDIRLDSNRDYEIQDGDKIGFADVDFWFRIKRVDEIC